MLIEFLSHRRKLNRVKIMHELIMATAAFANSSKDNYIRSNYRRS